MNSNPQQISCGSQYCVDTANGAAECTAKPSTCSAGTSTSFECTSEGFFPDPFNCHVFYQCLADNTGSIQAYDYKCPIPFVFDPSGPNNRYCRLTNGNSAFCSQVQCGTLDVENILMRFSWFPAISGQYVVTCIKDNPSIVTRCPAGFVADLNVILPRCDFVCNATAIAADPSDVTKYYECTYNAITRSWETTLQDCYRNEYFNKNLKTCVEAPACTNGANNPPKCNTCSGNKAFVDGSCKDCGKLILDATSNSCTACPTNAEYDAAVKKCVCTDAAQAIDATSTSPGCKVCPTSIAAIDPTTKECKCNNEATNPFANSACTQCSGGSTTSSGTDCPVT